MRSILVKGVGLNSDANKLTPLKIIELLFTKALSKYIATTTPKNLLIFASFIHPLI